MSRSSNHNNDDATAVAAKNMIDFLTVARGLKTTPRTGWVRQEANPRIESVADHSWRIALMAMVASSSSTTFSTSSDSSSAIAYDQNKCIKMALVHDLAEAIVGDITPHCGISDEDKHTRELKAMADLTSKLTSLGGGSGVTGQEILDLWKEYEGGTTNEAKLVKDMDKLEMILQALEYENDGENKKSLDGFFDSTRGKWRTSIGEAWGKEIESRRTRLQNNIDDDDDDDAGDDSDKPSADKETKLT
jgi:putative hydrolase of HD superfamily